MWGGPRGKDDRSAPLSWGSWGRCPAKHLEGACHSQKAWALPLPRASLAEGAMKQVAIWKDPPESLRQGWGAQGARHSLHPPPLHAHAMVQSRWTSDNSRTHRVASPNRLCVCSSPRLEFSSLVFTQLSPYHLFLPSLKKALPQLLFKIPSSSGTP